jgi:hypothetical protein
MATRDPERYFDRRTIKRHLKRGVVSEADFRRHVDGLPDVTDKIRPRDEGGDDDGFDGRGVRGQKPPMPFITAIMPEPRLHAADDDDFDDEDDDFDDEDDDEDDDDEDKASSDDATPA